ncbi:MAG TPA: AMP-binding protein [Ramlibacter sp.]|jgi:acyl-coenzyme A synthetase/AMP-(fatty) acid ligase|uniref:AMP-binding protein n=1 Tax=Ramlibacter sp. TaxID=1917967 RepID=UPI002D572D16|nr:AMP-binding protein [Ramlibacter sp.]HZY19961.1 AMP-binding protein [Ramlibacter sp.]
MTPGLADLPLLPTGLPPDTPVCWHAGHPISRRQYLGDVQHLAGLLRPGGPVLALTADRYRFAVAFGAAAVRGQAGLMPPNHTADTLRRLHDLFPGAYVLADEAAPAVGLPTLPYPSAPGDANASASLAGAQAGPDIPLVPQAQPVAHVLTSGSTGQPVPHAKHWGLLQASIRASAQRVAEHLGRPDLHGVSFVGTVPPQHMYGFESTVLLPLLSGAAFAAERPFFPQDVARVLALVPRPRVLVTTPVHLRNLTEAGIALPPVDLVISATAPLSVPVAGQVEAALAAPLMEIYGCTEAGQVATRRTTASTEWRTFDGLSLTGDGDRTLVQGGHVGEPTPLADVLEVLSPTRFRLLGRSNDMVNVAGKRTSLSHLNHQLLSIPGVIDGAFWLPPSRRDEDVVRLVALVVAPGLDRARLTAALRERIDAAFLPRRMVWLDSLPRDPSGKLPADRLAGLAGRLVGEDTRA